MYKIFAKYGLLALISMFGLLFPLYVALAEPIPPMQVPDRDYNALVGRIAALENQLADACRLSDGCKKNITQQVEDLAKYRTAEIEIKKKGFDKEVENSLLGAKLEMYLLFIAFFGLTGAAGYSSLVYKISEAADKVKSLSEERIMKEVSETIQCKIDTVKDLIYHREFEHELKKRPIILLVDNKEECDDTEKILRDLKFEKVQVEVADEYKLEENQGELIVFDHAVKIASIEKYLSSSDKKIFLQYFPKINRQSITGPNILKINFANSPITLHARIMESLIYQDIISKT
ncbi:MAG: hypothetical protein H7832_09910 [Magnetococcus sp. DMHC-6]